jgi:hypothetical protein
MRSHLTGAEEGRRIEGASIKGPEAGRRAWESVASAPKQTKARQGGGRNTRGANSGRQDARDEKEPRG